LFVDSMGFGGVEVCAELSAGTVMGDGLEYFDGSAGAGTVFEASSRTCSNIFEVSGVTGGFAAGFGGTAAGGFGAGFLVAEVGGGGFEAGFAAGVAGVAATGVFFVAVGVAFAVFGAAFVDFALVVDFLLSEISTSIGSEMTFLGLPLFLAISADISLNVIGF
jgi:hypothetical protein